MAERETLEVDILFVGGGPAGLDLLIRNHQAEKTAIMDTDEGSV